MNSLYEIMVTYRENLKLFHFQSKKFAQHKASDETLVKYDSLFDEFWEVYQGSYGRINIKRTTITIENNDIKKSIENTKFLMDVLTNFNKLPNLLLNIRDEIIDTLSKFLYLLSFD